MPCLHPIWIPNNRYNHRSLRSSFANDYRQSQLALNPWDVARQWMPVPCGKCSECLRRARNDWYVRLERELTRCWQERKQAMFITITINPSYYERALESPSWFIRRWFERLRHVVGHSVKHALFQEFGVHPETGSEPRLHFHGFLFDPGLTYNEVRAACSQFGFIWLSNATRKRARYCVKYVVKQIDIFRPDGSPISDCRRYTRKFISANVGNYLGRFKRPSLSVRSWSYFSSKKGVTFNYTIPRYYDRYLTEESRRDRAVLHAHALSRFSQSALVQSILDRFVTRLHLDSAVSGRTHFAWLRSRFSELSRAKSWSFRRLDPPGFLTRKLLCFIYFNYLSTQSPWPNSLSLVTPLAGTHATMYQSPRLSPQLPV